MTDHAHYSELCSLAASAFAVSGQLSLAESSDLIEHLSVCAECQELMRNFVQVSFALLPARTANHRAAAHAPNGALRRVSLSPPFLPGPVTEERAAEGLSKAPRRSILKSVARWTAVASSAAILIVLATTVALQRYGMLYSRHIEPGNGNRHADSVVTDPTPRALLEESARLKAELQVARSRKTVLNYERRERLDALATAQQREAELKARVAALESANTELRHKESGRNSELAQFRQDLERMRSDGEASHNAAALARIELADRSAELKRVSVQLSNARRLIATLSEAQDLIEGRAVHVWNVYYADENGKRQQAYGRILYEDGKKLVFYAYDLTDRDNVDTQLSFYVWGEKSGTHLPVKNLGVLHIDDSQKGRWKLTFDDPNVLAQINGVFVTAEPSNTAGAGPRGRRMLSASLESKTDHP